MNKPIPTYCLFLILLAICGVQAFGEAPDPVQVEVILVRASEGEAAVDANLKPYAATLQRLFRFDRYQTLARQNVTLQGAQERVSLGSGQALRLQLDESSARRARVEVEWTRGSTRLLQTRIQLTDQLPAVLGGPRGEDGILLLLVVRKG